MNKVKTTKSYRAFMMTIPFSVKGSGLEYYIDKHHSGAIMIFYDTSKSDKSKRDMCFMICSCEEWRVLEIWKEDVVA